MLAKALGLLPLDRALAMEDRERKRILEIERERVQKKIKRERECVCFLKGASEFIINK